MDKHIEITNYDLIDYESWANKGVEGLKQSVSEKEFEFYYDNSKDLKSHTEEIRRVLNHVNFNFIRKKPIFEDLVREFNNGGVCEVVLDAPTLDNKSGFSLHRVVVLNITKDTITIHDPRVEEEKPNRKVNKDLFIKAWLEAISQPELCVYRKESDLFGEE